MSKITSYKIVGGYKKADLERRIKSLEDGLEGWERRHTESAPSRMFLRPEAKGNVESFHAKMMARMCANLEMWRKQTSIEDKIIKCSSQGLSLQGAAVPLPLRGHLFHRYEQTMVKYV